MLVSKSFETIPLGATIDALLDSWIVQILHCRIYHIYWNLFSTMENLDTRLDTADSLWFKLHPAVSSKTLIA